MCHRADTVRFKYTLNVDEKWEKWPPTPTPHTIISTIWLSHKWCSQLAPDFGFKLINLEEYTGRLLQDLFTITQDRHVEGPRQLLSIDVLPKTAGAC